MATSDPPLQKIRLDPILRNRMTRYLHLANEEPQYFPGCWTSHKCYEVDKLKAIDEAIANNTNHVEITNLILKTYNDGLYTRYETILFALVKCLLVGSSEVKETAYKTATALCTTSEELLLFNYYTRLLKTGNGRGWCKFIKEWYMSKDPIVLAREVSRVRARHGRSHKTLIRKAHIKISEDDYARDAVIKYALFGLKHAKHLLGDRDETKYIFEYIEQVESLRICEDPSAAAIIVERNKFTLDHIPGHLLTSQEVWNVILPQMSLRELLYNIQRIHNMGFLTADSRTTEVLVSLINNQRLIKISQVTPIEVYITLCNYKKKSKPMKYEKAKAALEKQLRRRSRQIYDNKNDLWEWTVTKRHPKEIKNWGIDKPANPAVLAALGKLIDHTWLLTPPTKARYLITLDMRHHMFKGRHFCKSFHVPRKGKKISSKSSPSGAGDPEADKKESKKHLHAECFYNTNVTPGHAAIVLALHLLKREKKAKLAVFTEEGIQMVNIERNFTTIDEAEFVLRKANLGRVQLDAPMEWASKSNQKFDVFINMVDRTTRYMELEKDARGGRGPGGRFGTPPSPSREIPDHCPVRALERYRKTAGVKDAKLVVMSLASRRVCTTDNRREGILDVIGVDEHVPRVLDAFVLGHFK